MPQVTVHAAKAHLSGLIDAALAGEDVVISRGGKPVIRLAAIPRTQFKFGILAGELTGPVPDFFEPMSEEELALWETRS